MSYYLKDPGAVLDYAVNWGLQYLDSDTIATSSFTVDPVESGGAIVVSQDHDFQIATVTVGGGIAGRQYRVTNHVVLASGREDERMIVLRVEQR